jgi:hypothetical protein
MQHAIRVIGNGLIGGKAGGFWKARRLLLSDEVLARHPEFEDTLYFPRTICVATDLYDEFISMNKLAPLFKACTDGKEGAFEEFERACLAGKFPPHLDEKFSEIWDTMNYPLAVRSSSVLEDQTGTSFAGKYSTLFIANRGTHEERWEQLSDAIKKIFASIGNPNAIEYRRKHGHLAREEKMAVMLQRAVGREYMGYFFPLLAGVGFSKNGYCWRAEVLKDSGLVRLVFGLGTRAVGRGYARLFSPGYPTSRPEGLNAADIDKYSQATMDVLDLERNELKAIHFSEVVRDGFDCYPGAEKLFSLRDGATIYVPASKLWEQEHKRVLTFDSILSSEWAGVNFPKLMHNLMEALEEGFGYPVDIEFAGELIEGRFRLNLLQARPLTQREEHNPETPPPLKNEDIIFTAGHDIPTASIHDIEYIVYVDANEYFACSQDARFSAARVIGELNKKLRGRKFILMGPGRWGSAKVELGLPVKYAEICNTAMLVEMAVGRYAPEVSFGTHFFQDLIEDNIVYMPIFPEEPGVVFNRNLFESDNSFSELLSDPHDLRFEKMIRIIDVKKMSGGRLAHVILNGTTEKGIVYLK